MRRSISPITSASDFSPCTNRLMAKVAKRTEFARIPDIGSHSPFYALISLQKRLTSVISDKELTEVLAILGSATTTPKH
jgi:hypothetical protein